MQIRVAFTPPDTPLATGAGWTGVAIDVLRATSTLTVALGNGAAGVVAFADTADAIRHRDSVPGALACGERDGRIVPGFDLGNSPFEYSPERVRGRVLAFASTNGSRAIRALGGCERVLLAAFVNASAVLRALEGARGVQIVCAGKLGRFALEDAACAGWLCAALEGRGATLDASARMASRLAPDGAHAVRALVEGCPHGRVLGALGPEFVRDVAFCGSLDALDGVYALDGGRTGTPGASGAA